MACGALNVPGLFISSGDPGTVSDTLNTDPWVQGQLGQWAWVYPQASYWSTFNLAGRPMAIQYVKRSATDATTISAGALAFVKDFDDFVVTADASDGVATASNVYNCVGVFLGTGPAVGKYGFIGIGGICPVLLKTSPTVTITPAYATGNYVVVPQASGDLSGDAIGATQINQTTGTPAETTNADYFRKVVAKIISVKNTPSGIGANVVKGLLFPFSGVGGF